jgi:phospholipase/carboxylesterase
MLTSRTFRHRYVPPRIPAAAAGAAARERVVVVLHGLGDSLNGYFFLPEALGIPGLSYLLINAPDAYYGGYSWYEYMGDPAPGIVRSRGMLRDLLRELEDQGVAPADIFLFGFSQGCLMAVDAGLRGGDVLGGVIGVSGHVAFPEEYPAALSPAARGQKFLITHGRLDPVIPFEPARKQYQDLRKLGIDLEFVAYDKDHTMLREELDDIAGWIRGRIEQ